MTKACNLCGFEKPLTEFSPNPKGRAGHRGNCKTCRVAQSKVYQALHPEVHQKANEKYKSVHREEIRVKNKEYALERYKTQPEIVKAAVKKYQQSVGGNLKTREIRSRQKAMQLYGRKLTAIPVVLLKGVWQAYHGQCVYCTKQEDIDLDHIVPISQGGAHDADNLTLACGFCNGSKSNRDLATWAIEKNLPLNEILARIDLGRTFVAGIVVRKGLRGDT